MKREGLVGSPLPRLRPCGLLKSSPHVRNLIVKQESVADKIKQKSPPP